MEKISVFDIIKIGVGPSSSHTMGPWKAAKQALLDLKTTKKFDQIESVTVFLYGSLAKTGRGHGTDVAVQLGLCGEDPKTCDIRGIWDLIKQIEQTHQIDLLGDKLVPFDPNKNIVFVFEESLPAHPNGMTFEFKLSDGTLLPETFYSVGGGFIEKDGDTKTDQTSIGASLPYFCQSGRELRAFCETENISISELVMENERIWRSEAETNQGLSQIWEAMKTCVHRGCHTEGELPGGLNVVRRASRINRKLLGDYDGGTPKSWIAVIRNHADRSFEQVLKWISCFALAVNEENASFGRVVTAPTNGAAGVVPAVLMYYACFRDDFEEAKVSQFLLVAGIIGSLFKQGATISAAMGGCQAEIGVSSAMSAAALTECLGGSPAQALMAAEIAMEHHLGLTCDPIGGLVQIPCIERNSMGAIKAITACKIALESDPDKAKVSLDAVIKTMWDTAQDMNAKYKETSEGGLAVNIPVNVVEC